MKFKQYLPLEDYVIITDLPVQEVLKRVKDNVRPLSHSDNHADKSYQGVVTEPLFDISRVISYRNSFLPKIKGRVFSKGQKTHVIIKMRLFAFVSVFMTIWLSFAASLFFLMLFIYINSPQKFVASPGILLGPLGMFLFGYLLTILAFKAEAKGSKKFLEKLLESNATAYSTLHT